MTAAGSAPVTAAVLGEQALFPMLLGFALLAAAFGAFGFGLAGAAFDFDFAAAFGAAGGLGGAGGFGALGGYTNTPEGKALAAAFANAYNNLVIAMRDYRPAEVTADAKRIAEQQPTLRHAEGGDDRVDPEAVLLDRGAHPLDQHDRYDGRPGHGEPQRGQVEVGALRCGEQRLVVGAHAFNARNQRLALGFETLEAGAAGDALVDPELQRHLEREQRFADVAGHTRIWPAVIGAERDDEGQKLTEATVGSSWMDEGRPQEAEQAER